MPFQLKIAEGKEAGKNLFFDQDSVTIGRTPECDIILYDPGVSRQHARISADGDGYVVEDMGSANGTRVNGEVVQKTKLATGDALSLGPVIFNFIHELVEETGEHAPFGPDVRDESTRIVSVDDVNKTRIKAISLPPEGVSGAEALEMLGRATTALPARSRRSGEAKSGLRSTAPAPLSQPESSERVTARPRAAGAREKALSAADRARIRRESGGVNGSARIFWAESSGARKAGVLGALTLLLLGGGGAAFFFLRDPNAEPLKPEPFQLTKAPITDSFGIGPGVTYVRADKKIFQFEFNSPVRAIVILHYQALDIDSGEVGMAVNGGSIGTLPADRLGARERSNEVVIPLTLLKKGEPNTLIFDNLKNPPAKDPWRVWNVWIEIFPLPDIPVVQLRSEANDSFQKGSIYFERKSTGAENRYRAWKSFRNTWLMLEAHPDPKPELYQLARDRMAEAQRELDATCSKLMLEVESYYNHKEWPQARATLDQVKQYFPTSEQACPSRAEMKRDEYEL